MCIGVECLALIKLIVCGMTEAKDHAPGGDDGFKSFRRFSYLDTDNQANQMVFAPRGCGITTCVIDIVRPRTRSSPSETKGAVSIAANACKGDDQAFSRVQHGHSHGWLTAKYSPCKKCRFAARRSLFAKFRSRSTSARLESSRQARRALNHARAKKQRPLPTKQQPPNPILNRPIDQRRG